jgi:dienelactone hydrolase
MLSMSFQRFRGLRSFATRGVLLFLAAVIGCGPHAPGLGAPPAPNQDSPGAGGAKLTIPTFDPAAFPPLGPPRRIVPGVVVHETVLDANKIWIYLPDRKAEDGTLPCVLIAPAGATGINGMDLADGDRPEHPPYARAGMAVIAYSVSGPVNKEAIKTAMIRGAPDPEVIGAAQAFIHAQAGFTDAERALAFALARVPAIDANRIYTAGHSSAATLSLLVAENEPRVAACVAYAPCTDVRRRLTGNRIMRLMEPQIAGFGAFINQTSPINGASQLRCPLFLFHAQDDTVLLIADSAAFSAEVSKTNPNVTFVRPAVGTYSQAPKGGHYSSMIKEGVPKAIEWLKALPAK